MFFTACGSPKGLYKWEKDAVSPIADAAICYGGHSARNPYLWTEDRFEKTVAYVDENGQEIRRTFTLVLQITDGNGGYKPLCSYNLYDGKTICKNVEYKVKK